MTATHCSSLNALLLGSSTDCGTLGAATGGGAPFTAPPLGRGCMCNRQSVSSIRPVAATRGFGAGVSNRAPTNRRGRGDMLRQRLHLPRPSSVNSNESPAKRNEKASPNLRHAMTFLGPLVTRTPTISDNIRAPLFSELPDPGPRPADQDLVSIDQATRVDDDAPSLRPSPCCAPPPPVAPPVP